MPRYYPFNKFQYGLVSKLPIQSVPDGAAYDSLNWVTTKGKIELNRGYAILGTEQAGAGRITGLKVGTKNTGVQVPFASYVRKVRFYDVAISDWTEIGTDTLPASASGEDITFDVLEGVTGPQLWFNSPNTGPYKVIIGSPSGAVSMYDSHVNYKAWMRIFDNRAYNWWIDNTDKTAVRFSFIETRGLSDYTNVGAESAGTGDGATKTFTGTLNIHPYATAKITSDNTAPSDGDTVTIDGTVYTFMATVGAAFTVHSVTDGDTTLINLKKAINLTGVAGTDYGTGTTIHSTVTGTTLLSFSEHSLALQAKTLGAGNYITLAKSSTHLTVSGALFTGDGSKRSLFNLQMSGSGEVLIDNGDGTLTSTAGGTGTINYATGVYSITFFAAPANSAPVSANYYYVDETLSWASHKGGIANFVVPASRVSGEPNIFRQDHGGNVKSIISLKDHKFVFHDTAIYDILPTLDDTGTTNTLFRDNIGTKYLLGQCVTAEGIYVVDTRDSSNPRFGIVNFSPGSTDIKPRYISENLDLSNFVFDKVVIFAFFDYVIYACRTADSSYNNRTFVYNRVYKTFDLLDYAISCADIYNGTLIAGDSLSNNVQTLFSGFDANGDPVTNYWKSGVSRLGYITPRGKIIPIHAIKRCKKIKIEGIIGPDQILHMYVSLDRGPFVEVFDDENGPIIAGSGSYIDRSQSVTIGAATLGTKVIGGGGNGIEAYHFERIVSFKSDRFSDIQIMFQTSALGYCCINYLEFYDIRALQDKPARKYRDQ